MDFYIDEHLKNICPEVSLGIIQYCGIVKKKDDELWSKINFLCNFLRSSDKDLVLNSPNISSSKEAYKKLGKDPNRFRISSEALLRRVFQNKELYQINTIVDINNYVSLKSFYSVGTYNLQCLETPFYFSIGQFGCSYKGIGKQDINLENLPIFIDKQGPFGSPTSDSERAMITENATDLMMVVISFSGLSEMKDVLQFAEDHLIKYAAATNIKTKVIT